MNFGERLAHLRKKKGLSQYDVAQRLGIKRPRYNAWEQGISKPRADMMSKVAQLFDVTVDDLLGIPIYDGPRSTPEEDFNDDSGTIAAHREGDGEWTEEELKLIEEFKEFVRSQRKQQE